MRIFVQKLKRWIKNPLRAFYVLVIRINDFLPFLISDRLWVESKFYLTFDRKINLKAPVTFNEKLQWLKLYDHNPKYTKLVDKCEVKPYLASILGDEYIIPTLGIWDKPDDIDWSNLPNQFVLKCNHDSGGLTICKDKSKLDKKGAVTKLESCLKKDFYKVSREWPYKNVKRKIIAEKYLNSGSELSDLQDYKFFCFNGNVKFLKVDFNRFVNHKANYYDCDWNLLPFGEELCPPDPSHTIEKPINFPRMIEIAKELSKDLPFVRIDLFNVKGKIYIGEITLYPSAGMGRIIPMEWDEKIGNMLQLNMVK